MRPFALLTLPSVGPVVLDALQAHGLTPRLVITRDPTAPDARTPRHVLRATAARLAPGLLVHGFPSATRTYSAAWLRARQLGCATFPAQAADAAIASELRRHGCAFALVAGFRLVGREVLDAVPEGLFGLHPSVLPSLRGPAPIPWSLRGDGPTGISLFRLDPSEDGGPVILRLPVPLPDDTPFAVAASFLTSLGATWLSRLAVALVHGHRPSSTPDAPPPTSRRGRIHPDDLRLEPGLEPAQVLRRISAARNIGGAPLRHAAQEWRVVDHMPFCPPPDQAKATHGAFHLLPLPVADSGTMCLLARPA